MNRAKLLELTKDQLAERVEMVQEIHILSMARVIVLDRQKDEELLRLNRENAELRAKLGMAA